MPNQPVPPDDGSLPVLLFCGAFAPEIAPLLDLQGTFAGKAMEPRTIWILELGIGGLRAGLALERAIQARRPAEVVFLGSCGEYRRSAEDTGPGSFSPYSVFAREFIARDLASLEGRSKFLSACGGKVIAAPGPFGQMVQASLVEEGAVVNSTDSVTLAITPAALLSLAEGLKNPGRIFENLEAYALALVAQDHGIPFSALLAVTNRVGPQGSVEWQGNHRSGADSVCRRVRKLLHVIE